MRSVQKQALSLTHTHTAHMFNIIVIVKCSFDACIVSMLMSSFKLFNIRKIFQIMAHYTAKRTQIHMHLHILSRKCAIYMQYYA